MAGNGNPFFKDRPLITTDSQIYAFDSISSKLDDFDRLVQAIDDFQAALEVEVRPKIEAGEDCVQGNGRRHRRIAVDIEPDLLNQVWRQAEIYDKDVKNVVEKSHIRETQTVVGSHPKDGHFVLADQESEEEFANPCDQY